MKAAEDRLGRDDAEALNRAMERGILVQRAMNSRFIIISGMKRTPIAVATEYATRLVHLIQGLRLEEMAGFFDFEPGESKILLEDVLGTGLVSERNGQLVLSQRGHEALSPLTDTLELFEVGGHRQHYLA